MTAITLTTDFGKGFYAAQLKGVMISMNRSARIVDITHDVNKQNIFEGAFVISQVWRYFPRGTIHIGVVDPGVGSFRRGIIIKTDHCYFIGPDNGLFSLAIRDQKIENIIEIDKRKLNERMHTKISDTFPGMDVFAPTAAWISRGVRPDELGEEINAIKELKIKKNKILYTDDFGNIITSVQKDFKPGTDLIVRYKNREITTKFVKTFNNVNTGDFLVSKGSTGFLELAINQGNAANELKAKINEDIEISTLQS